MAFEIHVGRVGFFRRWWSSVFFKKKEFNVKICVIGSDNVMKVSGYTTDDGQSTITIENNGVQIIKKVVNRRPK